jgi:cell wall-associated NlpC family hydrolase
MIALPATAVPAAGTRRPAPQPAPATLPRLPLLAAPAVTPPAAGADRDTMVEVKRQLAADLALRVTIAGQLRALRAQQARQAFLTAQARKARARSVRPAREVHTDHSRQVARGGPRHPRNRAGSSWSGWVPPADGSRAGTVVTWALAQVGKPYVWGAAGPGSFDCSGLVMRAYQQVGVRLPHQSGGIAGRGRFVPAGQWQRGDVIAFPGHVALYIGNGQMVEAPHAGASVRVVKTRGGSARRIL